MYRRRIIDRIIKKVEEGKMYSEKEATIIFKQLMNGISYYHSKGICYRDLKPEKYYF